MGNVVMGIVFLGIDVVPVDESQASTFQNKRSTG